MYKGQKVIVVKNRATNVTMDVAIQDVYLDENYTLGDLLKDHKKLADKVDTLEAHHNELVSKYNALLAAYKANTAKTAMQLVDLEENR